MRFRDGIRSEVGAVLQGSFFFFNNVGLNVEDTGMESVMETGIIRSNELLRLVGGNAL